MTTTSPSLPAVSVIDDARGVGALLPPLRRKILASLRDPDSATGLGRRLGLARQKINYHMRELEKAGLVECVEERQRRGCVERCLRATSRAFVVSPDFLGELEADPESLKDQFSSGYLMAVASRTLRDVSALRQRARSAAQPLTTLAVEADVSFASPADLKQFAEELAEHVASLAARFHKPTAPGSRRYRFSVGGHPVITRGKGKKT